MDFQDTRYQRAVRISSALVDGLPEQGRDRVVYGVWLSGHSAPVYVGQTSNARRRLWDLPIGESHHLANSFPPEIWERVVRVHWLELLETLDPTLAGIFDQVNEDIESSVSMANVGLGLEYLLQQSTEPMFNARKKLRDGRWRSVSWQMSKSRGALIASRLSAVFERILIEWKQLELEPPASPGFVKRQFGSVVFPSLIADTIGQE
jgi:hypothetical protein